MKKIFIISLLFLIVFNYSSCKKTSKINTISQVYNSSSLNSVISSEIVTPTVTPTATVPVTATLTKTPAPTSTPKPVKVYTAIDIYNIFLKTLNKNKNEQNFCYSTNYFEGIDAVNYNYTYDPSNSNYNLKMSALNNSNPFFSDWFEVGFDQTFYTYYIAESGGGHGGTERKDEFEGSNRVPVLPIEFPSITQDDIVSSSFEKLDDKTVFKPLYIADLYCGYLKITNLSPKYLTLILKGEVYKNLIENLLYAPDKKYKLTGYNFDNVKIYFKYYQDEPILVCWRLEANFLDNSFPEPKKLKFILRA